MGIFSLYIPALSNMLGRLARSTAESDSGICSLEANSRILNSDQYGRIYVLPSRRGRLGGVRLVSVLSELKVGKTGVVEALDLPESVQNYLMHLGFLPEAQVTVLRRAPAGDPTVYSVDGMEIALRHETASAIRIHEADERTASSQEAVEPDSTIPAPDDIPNSVELIEIESGVAQ